MEQDWKQGSSVECHQHGHLGQHGQHGQDGEHGKPGQHLGIPGQPGKTFPKTILRNQLASLEATLVQNSADQPTHPLNSSVECRATIEAKNLHNMLSYVAL